MDIPPHIHKVHNETIFDPFVYSQPFVLPFITGSRVCEENKRWKHLTVDPFLGLLFNGGTGVSQPPAPSTKKYHLSTGGAIGIAIGAVVIIAIAVISTQVPAAKYFFRPHAKRYDEVSKKSLGESNRATSANWTAAKPLSPVTNTNTI